MPARDIYSEFQALLNSLTIDEINELSAKVYRSPNEFPVEFLRAVSVAKSTIYWQS